MCSIHSNGVADEGFREMGNLYREAVERKLAKMAGDDSIVACNGLGQLLNSVDDWSLDPILKKVKKFRCGRHRVYVTGHHSECNYSICYILVNKRDADDQSDKKWFQNRIEKAADEPSTRMLINKDE